ncbi:hypothetical protein D3260_10695 [Salinisphaera sp. Q1T1-3]|nr:hypothetical protein D3260_10695 [Salinisphaera sp. Q1T1-3]
MAGAEHSIPAWRGKASRAHQSIPFRQLRVTAHAERLRHRGRHRQVESFVQFAGFPRSGHSLIGAIIDAHPEARIAHELDAMGLIDRGFSLASVMALVDRHCDAFNQSGRWWNGFCYAMPGGRHERLERPRLYGDKKGDLALRRMAADPTLRERLANRRGPPRRWICVLRNPYDNIATMSLRQNRTYDALRTRGLDSAAFQQELSAHQADGRIAREAETAQIDEYARLCDALSDLLAITPAHDWHVLTHERLIESPADTLKALFGFLALDDAAIDVERLAGVVHRKANETRHQVAWSDEARARVEALINTHAFLSPYRDGR